MEETVILPSKIFKDFACLCKGLQVVLRGEAGLADLTSLMLGAGPGWSDTKPRYEVTDDHKTVLKVLCLFLSVYSKRLMELRNRIESYCKQDKPWRNWVKNQIPRTWIFDNGLLLRAEDFAQAVGDLEKVFNELFPSEERVPVELAPDQVEKLRAKIYGVQFAYSRLSSLGKGFPILMQDEFGAE